ncbi:hypothetical protein JOD96_002197 [Flavobacterium sp. 1355]|jgi:hypothetical protein|nr:hypothetical protein [Flavobacterium sp. 1355]
MKIKCNFAMVNAYKMDFNLTEISVINVVFVKEDSRLTIATTPTKGISIRR